MSGGDWRDLRAHGVQPFIRALARRHPELLRIVTWAEVLTMARREHVQVRVVAMPAAQRAALVRLGQHVFIQVNRALSRAEQTIEAMHELVHFWRDDPGVPCYYSDGDVGEREEFADVAAWYVTSPARVYLDSRPEEDHLAHALRIARQRARRIRKFADVPTAPDPLPRVERGVGGKVYFRDTAAHLWRVHDIARGLLGLESLPLTSRAATHRVFVPEDEGGPRRVYAFRRGELRELSPAHLERQHREATERRRKE